MRTARPAPHGAGHERAALHSRNPAPGGVDPLSRTSSKSWTARPSGARQTCGSRMRIAVELDWADRVVRMRQAVEACAYGQAAAALMGGHAMGRSAEEVGAALTELEAWLGGQGRRSGVLAGPRGAGAGTCRARDGMARSCCRSRRCSRRSRTAQMSTEAQAVDGHQRACSKAARSCWARRWCSSRCSASSRLGATLGYIVGGALIGPHLLGPGPAIPSSWPAFPKSASRCCCSSSAWSCSRSRLWRLRRDIFGLGLAQVVLCGLALSLFIHLALGVIAAGGAGDRLAARPCPRPRRCCRCCAPTMN